MSGPAVPVLVVGAGPTGLVLALRLNRHGIGVRIVERADGPGETSRAIAVHARTLEGYRQLGLAEAVVARGIKMTSLHLREGGEEVARLDIGEFGEGLSPYPFILSFPQDLHERFLLEELTRVGVRVEYGTELASFVEKPDGVRATLAHRGRTEELEALWLAGCDGARSTVRHALSIEFPGGTYDQRFFVADVRATGPAADGNFNACLDERDFCLVMPVREAGTIRLIGIVPVELRERESLAFADLGPFLESRIRVHVKTVNWFSTYNLHHRVADWFRSGRAFLAGDAGHIHSPAGGQGMNTGIGDAVNLAWKLAHVIQGRARPSLLESYEPERIAFARLLVQTTDTAFSALVDPSLAARLFRTHVVPTLMPFLLGFSAVRRMAFRTVSQVRVNYRGGPLASGVAGGVQGGDRLPWVPQGTGDNFEPLATLAWHVQTYGGPPASFAAALAARGLPLHRFPHGTLAEEAGIPAGAAFLVRPDGYVAVAQGRPDADEISTFLDASVAPAR